MKTTLVPVLALCSAAASVGMTMPDGTLALPLHRIVNQTSYAVEMRIGSPPQKMSVLVDTGSSFIGLQGTKSNWCKLSYKPCELYGSYNNDTSSTSKYKNETFYNSLINHGYGSYIEDTVRVGSKTFPKLTFGMITDYEASYPAPNPNSGLMGLVPFCNNPKCTKSPITTLQQQLLHRGSIKSNVLSIYLGPEEEKAEGHLLYAAIDRAKQAGPVVTMAAINPVSAIANLSPNYLNFSSMSLQKTKHKGHSTSRIERATLIESNVHKFNLSKGSYALIDTGYPGFTLPKEAWTFVKDYLGIKGSSDETGAYPVDCKFRKQQSDDATLLVGFKNDKLQIRIPLSRLVTKRAPGKCVTAVDNSGSNGRGCTFGDTFLRSAYTIFNFDDVTITMSNVKYTTMSNVVAA